MITERSALDHFAEAVAGMFARRRPTAFIASCPAPTQPRARQHRVIEALQRAGRPLTNADLAKALSVSPSRCCRLRAQVADQLRVERRGRTVMISIAD